MSTAHTTPPPSGVTQPDGSSLSTSHKPPTATIRPWLTVKQAAARISASASHIRKLIATGKLHASNIGTGDRRADWRVAVQDLERFMRDATGDAG